MRTVVGQDHDIPSPRGGTSPRPTAPVGRSATVEIPALTGLRAVAAVWVLVHHLSFLPGHRLRRVVRAGRPAARGGPARGGPVLRPLGLSPRPLLPRPLAWCAGAAAGAGLRLGATRPGVAALRGRGGPGRAVVRGARRPGERRRRHVAGRPARPGPPELAPSAHDDADVGLAGYRRRLLRPAGVVDQRGVGRLPGLPAPGRRRLVRAGLAAPGARGAGRARGDADGRLRRAGRARTGRSRASGRCVSSPASPRAC